MGTQCDRRHAPLQRELVLKMPILFWGVLNYQVYIQSRAFRDLMIDPTACQWFPYGLDRPIGGSHTVSLYEWASIIKYYSQSWSIVPYYSDVVLNIELCSLFCFNGDPVIFMNWALGMLNILKKTKESTEIWNTWEELADIWYFQCMYKYFEEIYIFLHMTTFFFKVFCCYVVWIHSSPRWNVN